MLSNHWRQRDSCWYLLAVNGWDRQSAFNCAGEEAPSSLVSGQSCNI
jgi:hypothetical protein